jgi:hypothetical protein
MIRETAGSSPSTSGLVVPDRPGQGDWRMGTEAFRGEGFISLIKAFSKAISGLSTNNTETYGQVVVGMYCRLVPRRASGDQR